jgi:hypothetical protein
MHLLKNKFIIIILFFLFVFSCKQEGPLSPEEAHTSLTNAYMNADAEKLESLLSERSKEKIRNITVMFASMNESQLKALGKKFNTDPARLKKLSVRDYLTLQFSQPDKSRDILKIITDQKITGVDINGSNSVARLENGMEISYVKEGRYWKFDMEELSSKKQR